MRHNMSYLIDDVARILATPMPRRKAVRLVGGALAAALLGPFAVRRAGADDCDSPNVKCGGGGDEGDDDKICCPPGTCCATHGHTHHCCKKNQCTCQNGTCASSNG